jgi:hypothetical protein
LLKGKQGHTDTQEAEREADEPQLQPQTTWKHLLGCFHQIPASDGSKLAQQRPSFGTTVTSLGVMNRLFDLNTNKASQFGKYREINVVGSHNSS